MKASNQSIYYSLYLGQISFPCKINCVYNLVLYLILYILQLNGSLRKKSCRTISFNFPFTIYNCSLKMYVSKNVIKR